MPTEAIENLLTELVNKDGIDYEQATELVRRTLDYLYGPRHIEVIDKDKIKACNSCGNDPRGY